MRTALSYLLATCFMPMMLVLGSTPAFSQVSLSIGIAPPPLPEYEQPACPDEGYLWTPGYWAYGEYGYYWVPGTWVQPPEVNVFWTPAYWAYGNDNYEFHSGYWGREVGYYGGINYGHGYGGDGYDGGRWNGRHFAYNSTVNNVTIINNRNTYAAQPAFRGNRSNVSFNGGNGGVQAQPTEQQRQFSQAQHIRATSTQRAYAQAASRDRGQLATANGGIPVTAAAARPDSYTGVAKQHAATQPLTAQDRAPAAQSFKRSAASASTPPVNAENQDRTTSPQLHSEPPAAPSHKKAVQPQAFEQQSQAPAKHKQTYEQQPEAPAKHTQTYEQPQTRIQPQDRAPQPQSRPQPQTHEQKPQSHPQPQTQEHRQPQAQAQKAQPHAKAEKPADDKSQQQGNR